MGLFEVEELGRIEGVQELVGELWQFLQLEIKNIDGVASGLRDQDLLGMGEEEGLNFFGEGVLLDDWALGVEVGETLEVSQRGKGVGLVRFEVEEKEGAIGRDR